MKAIRSYMDTTVPIIGIVFLLLGFCGRQIWRAKKHHPMHWEETPWIFPSLALLIFLFFWRQAGLIDSSERHYLFLNAGITLCGFVALGRLFFLNLFNRLATFIRGQVLPTCTGAHAKDASDEKTSKLSWSYIARSCCGYSLGGLLHAAMLVAVTCLSIFALETPFNPAFPTDIPQKFVVLEFCLIFGVCIALYFLGQRRGLLVALVPILSLFAGVALGFVYSFRATVITPVDLFALRTAADVAGNFSYVLSDPYLYAIAASISAVTLCAFLFPVKPYICKKMPVRAAANTVVGLVCTCLLIGLVATYDFRSFGITIDAWNTTSSYLSQGSLVSFITEAQNMSVKAPEGYTKGAAQSLINTYATTFDNSLGTSSTRLAAEAQFAQQQPDIVVVMDETFSDLSIYNGLACNYPGPTFFKYGMPTSLASGSLSVSVLGGGTCNTEFEMLTGLPLAYVGGSNYPYAMYDLKGTPNLASQLAAEGYDTTAIHALLGTNWNRDTVYENFGFERFITIDDFENAPYFHNFVSDRATFDKTLEVLREGDGPQFVLNITIQNHSGYTTGSIPEDRLTDYHPNGYDDGALNSELNEYLSCIQASDEDLAYFVDELSKLDRPVVLVYFGDHQPSLGSAYNDLICQEDAGTLTHQQRAFQTVYTIWTNYEVPRESATTINRPSSPSFLSAQMLYAIGAPLTDYQKAQLVISQEAPCLNSFGIQDIAGTWYPLNDTNSPLAQINRDYSYMAYYTFESRKK